MITRFNTQDDKHNKIFIYFIVFMLIFCKGYQEYFTTYTNTLSISIIENISVLLLFFFFSLWFLIILCFLSISKFYFTKKNLLLILLIPFSIFNINILIFLFTMFFWSMIKSVINNSKYISIMFFNYLLIIISVLTLYNFGVHHLIYEMRFGVIETYGLEHQNLFPTFIFLFSVFFILMFHKNKYICFIYLISMFIVGSIYFTARSFQVGLLLIFIFYIKSFFTVNRKYSLIPFFLFFLTLIIIYYLNSSKILGIINIISSNRFYYSYVMLEELNTPISFLFGSSELKPALPLDNSYVAMIYKYGLVPTLIYLYLLKNALSELIHKKENLIVCMICVIAVFALFENILPRIIFNFVVFFMVKPLFITNIESNYLVQIER